MTYKRVIINGEVYPGEDVKEVVKPVPPVFWWTITFKNGITIYAMGEIVVEVKE